MRKRIAVYLGETTGELQERITRSIAKYANALDYDVITFCTYGSYNDDYLYADGEKACISLPDFSIMDGVILTEDVFNIDGMADSLYEVLKKNAKCPVVYMRTVREGFHSALAENKQAIVNVTKHFLDEHGFRDICYMSGRKDSPDAVERLDGYMVTMAEYGIPVTEHMIFHGDYWREKGEEAINWFMEGRDSYPEAIVCANDYMAISICEELKRRGVRIPEDVCVSGFDYVLEARQNEPRLTTLAVDFDEMSKKAVSIIDEINKGNQQPDIVTVVPKLILQESCGSGKCENNFTTVDLMAHDYRTVLSMKHIMLSATEYQDAVEEDEYLWITQRYADLFRSNCVYLCLCDVSEEGYSAVENDSVFTDKMILKRSYKDMNHSERYNIKFDRKDILPAEVWKKDEPANYMVFSLHFKNMVYGYIVAEFLEEEWFDIFTQGYIMNLANAIQNAAMQKNLANLEVIRSLYQKDALTGLYNRRGFDRILREQLVRDNSDKEYFAVSIDMDDLKYINDTFGHVEGDHALKLLADALLSVIHENECCSRNGGDEFAALLCSAVGSNREMQFVRDFYKALDKVNELDLPYRVEASVGICSFNECKGEPIVSCIQKADMRMYENKKYRKSQGKKL